MNLIFHAISGRPAWPRPLYARIAAGCLDDGALVNALRVEPDLGTPARGGVPATTARWTGGWELTGHKIYATGAPALRWMHVWAAVGPATDPTPAAVPSGVPGVPGGSGVSGPTAPRVGTFLVPAGAPGVTIVKTWDHLGMRATESHDVVFDRVLLSADAAVGLADPGAASRSMPPDAVAWNALAISSIYLGVAESARDWLVRYLHQRVPSNLGAPLASLPRFQSEVGRIEVRLANARTLVRATARDVDAGDTAAALGSNAVKTAVTAAAIEAVGDAVALVGNPGLSRVNPALNQPSQTNLYCLSRPCPTLGFGGGGRRPAAERDDVRDDVRDVENRLKFGDRAIKSDWCG